MGLALTFNQQIKVFTINLLSQNQYSSAQKLTRTDIKRNQRHRASYNFKQVNALGLSTVTKAATDRNLHPIGLLSIPSVKIDLPIMAGLSNENLAVGAATMKAKQHMGKGNYALAGHHMVNKHILFSPLTNIKLGERIYITDKKHVYTYKVTLSKTVYKMQVQYIDNVKGKKLITLVTCASSLVGEEDRHIVQGQLLQKQVATKARLAVFKK
ncbi:sortase A [Lacticaseibacillus thailandensis DSM 22698 = JCM 13996]|uniref:Sortase A n=1 Tax=Lacticaseibacillus thailandensis DSM 22698 = JCM 13996 TaxID=1423810 RepID=A0A0R2C671_9LACO|nr:sortase A [Lacticaseibacillus thailandensis DSM 22698 = JCM 13996]